MRTPVRPLWYRDAAIYQIDPSTFADSTGDGSGDLRGVTARLDHVRALGANCVWLLPFYRSPLRDGGYDVSDHLGVEPRLGDLADFVALMERADELGIRILVDLVAQHTSDQHPWFQQARADSESRYRDYYLWTDDPGSEPEREPVVPTVEDSVWSWDERAGCHFRHMFYRHEPDLDLANPRVQEEIERIMAFWLRLGVSGFRIDAAPYLVEAAAGAQQEESGMWVLERMRDVVDLRRPEVLLLGEVDVRPEEYADYFGTGNRLTMLLNFWASNFAFLALSRGRAAPLVEALRRQPRPPHWSAYANFLRNHDELDLEQLDEDERHEVLTRFAPEDWMRAYGRGIRRRLAPMLDGDDRRIAMAHALLFSLPGVPVLLYGDEIGQGDDPERPERMAVRTPMQWSGGPGGFSRAPEEQWVTRPVPDPAYGSHARNVHDQSLDGASLLSRVGTLVRTRLGMREIGAGHCTVLDPPEPSVLALRYDDDGATVFAMTNLGEAEVSFTLPGTECLDDLVDVLADRTYPAPEGAPVRVRLGGYGYRWLRPRADLFR